jgi:hypothetical protein
VTTEPEPVEQPAFCTHRPLPGQLLTAGCPDCGHALIVHIGVEHCPVCEMQHLNQQARAATVTWDQVVRGEVSINAYRAARGLPPAPAGIVGLSDREVDAAVERILVRVGRSRSLRRPYT